MGLAVDTAIRSDLADIGQTQWEGFSDAGSRIHRIPYHLDGIIAQHQRQGRHEGFGIVRLIPSVTAGDQFGLLQTPMMAWAGL